MKMESRIKLCYKCKTEKSINHFHRVKKQKNGKIMCYIVCRSTYNRKIKYLHGYGKEMSYSNLYKHVDYVKALNLLSHSYLQSLVYMKRLQLHWSHYWKLIIGLFFEIETHESVECKRMEWIYFAILYKKITNAKFRIHQSN